MDMLAFIVLVKILKSTQTKLHIYLDLSSDYQSISLLVYMRITLPSTRKHHLFVDPISMKCLIIQLAKCISCRFCLDMDKA